MRTVLLLVSAVLAAGCTTGVEGTPTAMSPAPVPSRPREMRLDGVDPCSILTPEQRATLGLQSEPSASRPYVALFRGDVPTCKISGSSPGSNILGIGTVTSVGVERWRENDVAAQLRPTIIEGFPALVTTPTQSGRYCGVEVDVAAGQLLDVQVLDGGASAPQTELCRSAERAAMEIMKRLIAG
jgi:hypothetical protein